MLKDRGPRIDGARAADDDAQAVFGETVFEPQFPEAVAAGSEQNFVQIERARTGHDGVGGGAEFVEVFHVTAAAEG